MTFAVSARGAATVNRSHDPRSRQHSPATGDQRTANSDPRSATSELAARISREPLDAERLCLIEENGGPSPELLAALDDQNETLRTKTTSAYARGFAMLIERLARETGQIAALSRALSAISATYVTERKPAEAESYAREAYATGMLSGDNETIGLALSNLAVLHRGQARIDLAAEEAQEALTYARSTSLRARMLNTLGLAERTRGNLDAALAAFLEASALFRQLGEPEPIAGMHNNMGTLYRELGDDATAAQMYEKALAVSEPAKIDRVTAYALNNLGEVAYDGGDDTRAVDVLQRSLAIKERLGDRVAICATYLNLGEVERHRRHSRTATGWYVKTLSLAVQINDRQRRGEALSDMARLALDDHLPHLALDLATHALSIGRDADNLPIVISGGTSRGDALHALGRDDEALAAYGDAVATIENERLHAAFPEAQRAMFLERRLDSYDGIIRILARRKPREALIWAERAKARVLLDILSGGTSPPAVTLPKLPAETAAIEFVVTEGRTLAFLLRDGAPVRAVTITIPQHELAKQVRAFHERITQRDLGVDADAARLFQLLLGGTWPYLTGAWPYLTGTRQLVIVPDGPLWELPFQALRAPDGKYLLEHAAVSLAPSLSTLAAMHDLTRHRSEAPVPLVAFGNPQPEGDLPSLPQAETQVREIAKLYGPGAHVYLGAAATERRLKDECPSARVLHIATHGVLNDVNPMYSHLVLARDAQDDGRLHGREIARLPLHSDLVILSACDTARGRTRGGEGVIGMSWALFLAGCPSTVVSQWAVDAATTTSLMVAFHRELRAGATESAALRDAALAVMHDPQSRHPYYWAPFVLIGDDGKLR